MLSLKKGRILFALCALAFCASSVFAQTGVRLNEILASNRSFISGDGAATDWIELINTTGSDIDLSGASISDDELDPIKWSFPSGVTIQANSYLMVYFDAERPGSTAPEPYLNTGYTLNADGATVFLFGLNFGEVLDQISFGAQVRDRSIGRIGNTWQLCDPTPSGANTAASLGAAGGLRINEWMANPASGDDDWFEIFNTGPDPVSLGGLYLTDLLTDKTKFKIVPLSFVGSGVEAYVRYVADGNTNRGPEHVSFELRGQGEAIGIYDNLGTRIDSVTFGGQTVNTSQGRLPDGTTTITDFPGTPSKARSNFKNIPAIVVNELLSHTDPPLQDAVEFYNKSDSDMNIGGWYLSNKETDLKQYRVPPGTVIPAKGFKVFYEATFNDLANTNVIVPFAFNSAHGDQVFLAEADAGGNLTGFRVGEEFEAAENGVSFGRVETSVTNDHKFVAMASLTFGVNNPATTNEFATGTGAPNSAPRVGPIVFTEVHFNPLSLDGLDNREDEFIEMHNISGAPVRLYDPLNPENHWRLQNGVSFVFPGGRTIPAGGYFLVVSFDPNEDPIAASNFKFRWNVPTGVQLFGPFRGDLNNDGDSLELYKPDPPQLPPQPDAGFVPYTRVDKVNYTDRAPWPATADGTGFSLQRKNPLLFGNEPLNWDSAEPTPGRANSADLADTDGDGMTDTWEDANQFDKNSSADAAQDADSDGYTNLQEFIAGTNPRNASSRLTIKSFRPAKSDTEPPLITFTAAANKAYSVDFRNSLAPTARWQKLFVVPAESVERDVTVEDTDPEALTRTDRYYRVATPPTD